MPTCPAAAASRRRALASSWPAVSRGTLPSPCCSLTTTSSVEVIPGGCLSPPPSLNSSVDGAPQREHRLCLPGHFNSPALKLRNVGPLRYQRGPAFRTWVITASQGLGLSPSPPSVLNAVAACSLCQLGEPPAHPLNLIPIARNSFPPLPRLDRNGLISHL